MIRERGRHRVRVRSNNAIWENYRTKTVSSTVWENKFCPCQKCLYPGAWRTLRNGTPKPPASNPVEHRLRKACEANGVDTGDVLAAKCK